jgi:hypothetical protein
MLVIALVTVLVLIPRSLESSPRRAWPVMLVVIGVWLTAAAASSTLIGARIERMRAAHERLLHRWRQDAGSRGFPTPPVGAPFRRERLTALVRGWQRAPRGP